MAQYENLTGWEKLSLGKQLDKWAVQYGDRIAVADREKEITYYSIKPVMLKEALEKILNGENRNIKK